LLKIALTGGIACGKSLVAKYLRESGVETLDADDIVHELIPADERKRLAKIVFSNPAERHALEARIHPLVKSRLTEWINLQPQPPLRIAIIPLLFETHWDRDYDIILCVTSEQATQVSRMMASRGYTRDEAEARLAAQLPVAEKAAKSHYVIDNDGTVDALRTKVGAMVAWLKERK